MTQQADDMYYITRAPKLVRGFERVAKRAARSLTKRYGEDFSNEVIADARLGFQKIIPELPYVGGRENRFTWVIVANGWMVALFRAMKSRGKSAEEVVQVCCDVTDEFFRSFPRFVLRLGGRMAFKGLLKNMLKKQAALSQERRYPEDWVFTFREEAKDEWALEFTECAVNKFYEAQGAEELKPYCNFFDVTYSRLMGTGLDARETIGLGCETCSLRYKRGRETVIPERLKGLLPGT